MNTNVLPVAALEEDDDDRIIIDFAETTHVPVTYINNRLSAVGTQSQISDSVKALLKDLEHASRTAAKKLDILIDEMLRTAPRIGYDVEVLQGDLSRLGTIASASLPKRETLSRKGELSVKQLAMLENVKQKMEETRKIFGEAQAWSPPESIEEPVSSLIASKDYSAAAGRVSHYEDLLQVYKGTSEFARRKAVVERLRKKLLDVKRENTAFSATDITRASIDSQRSSENNHLEEGYYSSFIKRAFKT